MLNADRYYASVCTGHHSSSSQPFCINVYRSLAMNFNFKYCHMFSYFRTLISGLLTCHTMYLYVWGMMWLKLLSVEALGHILQFEACWRGALAGFCFLPPPLISIMLYLRWGYVASMYGYTYSKTLQKIEGPPPHASSALFPSNLM